MFKKNYREICIGITVALIIWFSITSVFRSNDTTDTECEKEKKREVSTYIHIPDFNTDHNIHLEYIDMLHKKRLAQEITHTEYDELSNTKKLCVKDVASNDKEYEKLYKFIKKCSEDDVITRGEYELIQEMIFLIKVQKSKEDFLRENKV